MRGLKDQKHKLGYGCVLGQRALSILQQGAHKGLSLILSFCLAFQPLLVQAQAMGAQSPVVQENQGIKAAEGVGSAYHPTVGAASNGVPLIDIARPNGQGLSHNKYDSFNVDAHGVILNNSTKEVSPSQLGGLVIGNSNLRGVGSAKVILNEVVSTNRSRLEGMSEVHGQAADVIVANPNGITCNGCGFINTPRVTLSSGQPIIGADGVLSGFRVEGGNITIGSRGADGSSVDIFDLVSRKISVEGPIQVKGELAVVAGHNHFDYHKREATSLGSDGKEPELAIDSSEFGGMYAGQIRVLANDKGAGVKMNGNMVANAGAMRLTSDGKLVLAKARAKGALKAHSHHDSVHVQDLLFSEEAVELKALNNVELAEHARVAAGDVVTVHANRIKLERDALLASGIGSDGTQSATGSLHLQATKLEAGNGRIAASNLLEIQAAEIDLSRAQDNDQAGVSSLGDLTIKTNQISALNNHIGAKGNVLVKADDALTIGAGHYSAGGSLLVEAAQLRSGAHLVAEQKVDLYARSGDLVQEGIVLSNGEVTLDAHGALNHKGDIIGVQKVAVTAGGMVTTSTNSTLLGHDVGLSAGGLTQAGTIEAQGGTLSFQVRDGVINSGMMRGENINAHAGALTNQGTLIAIHDLHLMLNAQEGVNSQQASSQQAFLENASDALLQSGGVFVVIAGQLHNAGALGSSGESVALNVAGDMSNSGLIYAKKSAALSLDGALTNKHGKIIAEDSLTIGGLEKERAGRVVNEAGVLSVVTGEMKLVAASLSNKGDGAANLGQQDAALKEQQESKPNEEAAYILARGGLRIDVGAFENIDSLISTQGAVSVVADDITQTGRIEVESGDLHFKSHGDFTNSGAIESNGAITVHAQKNLNQIGRIVSKARVELSSDGTLMMGTPSEVAAYDVALTADILTQAGLVEAQGGALTLNSKGVLSNYGIMVGSVVDAKLGSLANTGQLLSNGTFTLVAAKHDPSLEQVALVLNGEGGVLKSGGAFVLTADVLDNTGSIGSSGDGVALNVSGDLSNSGLIYAKKSAIFSLDGSLLNKFGDVIAEDNLTIRGLSGERAGHVINSSGLLEAVSGDMTFDVSALTNMREGGVEVSDKVVGHSYVRGEWEKTEVRHHQIKKDVDTTIIRQQPHFTNNAAQILAGRHLTVHAGDIRNSYSLIAANGNIVMHGDTLLNEGRDLTETTKVVTETHRRKKHCITVIGGCGITGITYYGSTTDIQTATRTYDAVYGTIEAGGTLDAKLTGYIDNHAVREGVEQVGLSSGDKGLAGVKNTDFDGSKPLISNDRLDGIINGLTGHKGLFAPSTKTPATETIQVPTQDGLSSVKTEVAGSQSPDVPFLVETRPDFVNPSKFLGSDYFLKRVGNYKPEHVFKKLGDAYYEYRLVGEQIFELTGNRTLLDVEDPNAQMQRLYDNAVEQQGPLGLELGVPLTPQQIAGIKKDMIWLETHLVDGQEVLVPRVYLASGSQTHQGSLASAHLKGHGITLAAERLTNSGTVFSDNALHIKTTKTLFNDGGFLLGSGAVDLSSDGLLANSSGVIHGDTITMTGNTIINSTAKIRDKNANGFVDRAGQKAQILSDHALSIQSLGDLGAEGGEFTSGGPMTMIIGGTGMIGALALESEHKETLEKGHYDAQSRDHRLSEVNSGENLTIVTNGALIVNGAKVKAKGDADFTSGDSLTMTSVQNFSSYDLDLRGKEGDKSKQKNKFRQQSTQITTDKTTVETGGKFSAHAKDGDLTLGAVGLKSGGEIHLAADKGKIQFLSNKDQDFKDTYQRNENLVWWSESDKGYLKETIKHVTIEAGGGMKLDAGNGIVVEYEKTGDLDKSLEQLSHSPGLSWIKQLRDDPELSKQVDWQAVRAEFKDWNYKAQGLTEAGAALVALAVTAVTGGAASGAASAITGALGLGSSTAMNAAIQAGVQALINKSAIALVNNRGNIAAALHELGSSKNVLSIVSSMLTAGLTSQVTEMAGVGQSLPKTAPFVDRITREAEKNLIKAAIGTSVQTALEGGSFDKNFFNNLRIALSDTVGKTLAEEIGTAKAEGKIDTVTQIVAHAGLGCLKGAVASGACTAGAVGGAVGEATAMLQFKLWMQGIIREEVGDLNGRTPTAEEQARITAKIDAQFADFREHTIDIARAAGGVAAALAGGDVNAGADAAGNAAANNFLGSAQRAQMEKELKECPDDQCRRDVNEKWYEISEEQDRIFGIGLAKGVVSGAGKAIENGIYATAHDIKELGLAIGNSSVDEIYQNALKGGWTAMSWAVSGHVINDVWGGAGKLWEGAGQFWGGVTDSFVGYIDHVKENMDKGGEDGALRAGFEAGQPVGEAVGNAAYMVGSIVATDGVAAIAKGGVKLAGTLLEKDLIKFAAKAETTAVKTGEEIAQSIGKMSDEIVATQYLGQERKFWSADPIEVEFEMTYKGEKITQKNKVYQREDLFDPNRISEWEGKNGTVTGTNIERMKTGRAPIGFDNEPVNLHHMLQIQDSPLAEVSQSFHQEHSSVIHIYPKTQKSLIDRDMFDRWRPKYWQERAKIIEEKMKLKQQQFMENKL